MRPEKLAIVQEIQDQLADASFLILTDFSGMDTTRTMTLRRSLKEHDARFQVVPNRLFRVAAQSLGYEGIEAGLKGPTALVFGSGDVAATAKALSDFAKANKMPSVKLGHVDGRVLAAGDVDVLANLPPKPVMQGMLVGTIAAPMSNLVGVMNQKLASLVYVLKAAAEKNSAA